MKKYILIMLAVVVFAALAGPVYAVADLNGPLPGGGAAVTTTIGGAAFQPSTNVYFHICSTDATGTPPNAYNAMSQNAAVANNPAGRQFGATNTSAIQFATAGNSATNFTTCTAPAVNLPTPTTQSTPSTPNWTNL
jgi:hypothetical protein